MCLPPTLLSSMVAGSFCKIAKWPPTASGLPSPSLAIPARKAELFPRVPEKVPGIVNWPRLTWIAIPKPISVTREWNVLLGEAWILSFPMELWMGSVPNNPYSQRDSQRRSGCYSTRKKNGCWIGKINTICYKKDVGKPWPGISVG